MNGWGYMPYPYVSVPDYRGYFEPNWEQNKQVSNQSNQDEKNDLLKELEGQINGIKDQQISTYEKMLSQFLRNQLCYRISEIQREITPDMVLRHFNAESK